MKKLILPLMLLVSIGSFAQKIGETVVFYVEPQNRELNGGHAFCAAIVTGYAGNVQPTEELDLWVLWPWSPQIAIALRHATDSANAQLSESWSTFEEALSWGYIPENKFYPGFKPSATYSGTTNGSGLYTVTFSEAYPATPNIQATIIGGTTDHALRVVSVSTTGFQVHVYELSDQDNVSGASVQVLITQQ